MIVFLTEMEMNNNSSRHCFIAMRQCCMETLNMQLLAKRRANNKQKKQQEPKNLLQLLIKIPRPLMETHHTRNSHPRPLQVRHTSRYPIGAHAHSRKVVHSRFSAQVVDLHGRGVEFEERVVDSAWDGFGEGVHGLVTIVVVDGGDGGGDYGGPFLVGVAVCHFLFGGWCLGGVSLEVRGGGVVEDGPLFNILSFVQ